MTSSKGIQTPYPVSYLYPYLISPLPSILLKCLCLKKSKRKSVQTGIENDREVFDPVDLSSSPSLLSKTIQDKER